MINNKKQPFAFFYARQFVFQIETVMQTLVCVLGLHSCLPTPECLDEDM